jgi:4-carboxymuconolactone decarboxylase
MGADINRGENMSSKKYEEGLRIRREVLGDEHVERALSAANAFTRPMQDLVTENCWGEVWQDGVRGALRNGCSVDEIQDVLLHCAVYCGVPAGVEAFRAAREVIDEWQQGQQ